MDTLQFQKNPETAAKMSAYMKHQFVFAGIPAPERQALAKIFWVVGGVASD